MPETKRPDYYYSFPTHTMDIMEKVNHLRDRSLRIGNAATDTGCESVKDIAKLYESFAGCMSLLAAQLPYKKGDRVCLIKAPRCEGGWSSSKHFLIVGAVGTVKVVDVDYLMRDWAVYVEFDNESWICSWDYKHYETGVQYKAGDHIPVPSKDRHIYGFHPNFIEKISSALPDQDLNGVVL